MEDEIYLKQNLNDLSQRIRRSEISEKNKQLIFRFGEHYIANGRKELTVVANMERMLTIARIVRRELGKELDEVDREDIEKLVCFLEKNDYKGLTKQDMKQKIKSFYRWLEGGEEYPDKVRWIKTTSKNYDKKLPSDMLTQEEVLTLIKNASRPRDKAFVSFLYESGCRISEVLNMKIKDIQFDNIGATVNVHGKTGYRRIRLVVSVPHLANWIENYHPNNDRESWVWVNVGNKHREQRMNYEATRWILESIAVKSGFGKFILSGTEAGNITRRYVGKHVNAHNFRHTRATHLANHLTEAQMKEFFGWIQSSNMASVYVHLSGRDIDKAIQKVYGIEQPGTENEEHIKPKICSRCETNNSPEVKYCIKCGLPLDQKTILEIENDEKELLKIITPDIMDQMIERKVKELLKVPK